MASLGRQIREPQGAQRHEPGFNAQTLNRIRYYGNDGILFYQTAALTKALVNFGRVSVAASSNESLQFMLIEEDVLLVDVDEKGEDRLYCGKLATTPTYLLFSRGLGVAMQSKSVLQSV